MSTIAEAPPRRQDASIISVVAVAHFTSHLLQLSLPSLFILLHTVLGVSFTELGLIGTAFYAASGFGQSAAGVLVDRFGAYRVLLLGLIVLALGIAGCAFLSDLRLMVPLAFVAGAGNSVFHPADLSILSHRVSEHRLGRAFAVHGIAGSLGFAAGAGLVPLIAGLFGWRAALLIVAVAALGVSLLLLQSRDLLTYAVPQKRTQAGASRSNYLDVVRSPVVLLAFGYFALTSFAGSGIQTQGAAALAAGYDLGRWAAFAVTAYLVGSAIGIVGGGFLAERTTSHHRVAMAGIAIAACLLLSVAWLSTMPLLVVPVLALAGAANGITGPSRDMIIRQAAKGSGTGSIFGFVYSGFDLGSSTAPLLLGMLLDNNMPHSLFIVAAIGLFLAVPTVMQVAERSRRRVDMAVPAE